jgi:hypothetical protein
MQATTCHDVTFRRQSEMMEEITMSIYYIYIPAVTRSFLYNAFHVKVILFPLSGPAGSQKHGHRSWVSGTGGTGIE